MRRKNTSGKPDPQALAEERRVQAEHALDQARRLAGMGAVFYASHSGGKDSQAVYHRIRDIVPESQITVLHADLGRVEWTGIQDHITENVLPQHRPLTVRAGKDFIGMVRHRHATRPDVPSWPSSAARQCTSDLKRNPLEKAIRHDMKARGTELAVSCVGLRREESGYRARKVPWAVHNSLSKAGRQVFTWLPVLDWTEAEIFGRIEAEGQKPFHAYAEGNRRLSCVLCIMACPSDLANGKRLRPDLYEEYRQLERETGWTMFPGESLDGRIAKAA